MNICVYEWALHRIGGGQKVFVKIAEALSKKHDVTILTLFKVDIKDLERGYNSNLKNVKIRYLFESKNYSNESLLHTL
jgi:hypothetical protein